jgi:hypothetical protein
MIQYSSETVKLDSPSVWILITIPSRSLAASAALADVYSAPQLIVPHSDQVIAL